MKNSIKSLQPVLEQQFGFTETPVRVLGGLSHEVFLLNDSNVIIKVYSEEITKERLDSEVRVLKFLSGNKSINTPELIKSLSGEFRVKIDSTVLSCFKKVSGEKKYLLTEAPTDLSKFKEIGEYLGKLHYEFKRDTILPLTNPRTSPVMHISKYLPSVNAEKVNQLLEDLKKSGAPYFTTHGDFQQSNLLYIDGSISGVIDFEYVTNDYRIVDIAGCLSNLSSASQNKKRIPEFIKALVEGYESTFGEELLGIEREAILPIIRLIWSVNIRWAEEKLKTTTSEDSIALLKKYITQTTNCLS